MKRIAVALFFLAAAFGAAADELPRFLIERIEIQGARRVSRAVIVAESRLREGSTYTESDLREAAERLRRAPYLLSADFALQKGSERGKYVLVVTVNETKPFFYELNAAWIHSTSPTTHIESTDLITQSNPIAFGYRKFLGSRGEIHFGLQTAGDTASVIAHYSSFVAGYTQYDVLGTRAFVTVNLTKPSFFQQQSSIGTQVVAGIPLSINQTIAVEYDPTYLSGSTSSQSQRVATARWSYNTTNHPVLPTRGTYIAVAPSGAWTKTHGTDFFHQSFDTNGRAFLLEMTAVHWREFTDRDSGGAGVSGGVAWLQQSTTGNTFVPPGSTSGTSKYATLDLTFAHSFWPAERVARSGDSRVQIDLRAGPRTSHVSIFQSTTRVRQISASWVRRNSWGLLRLGVGYAW